MSDQSPSLSSSTNPSRPVSSPISSSSISPSASSFSTSAIISAVYKPVLVTTTIVLKTLPSVVTPIVFQDYKDHVTTKLKINQLIKYLTTDTDTIIKNILLIYTSSTPAVVEDHVIAQSSTIANLLLESLPFHHKQIRDCILNKYNNDDIYIDKANVVWSEILDMFKNTNPFHTTNLIADLLSITHVSSIDPRITIEQYNEIGRQLKLAGMEMPNGFIAGLIINKLPPDMISLQQTLLKPGIPKMEDIYQHMKIYYESKQSKQITTSKHVTNTNSNNFSSLASFQHKSTNICSHFTKHGSCKYADQCRFVHETESKVTPTPTSIISVQGARVVPIQKK
jgi:hypothetical protein